MTHLSSTTTSGSLADSGRVLRPRFAPLAALFSFLFPGAGQFYNRQSVLAIIFATPIIVVIAAALLAMAVAQATLLTRLLDSRFLIGLMILNAVIFGWRLVAIVQAHAHRAPFDLRRAGTYATIGLLLVTAAMHAVPALYGLKVIDTVSSVALGGDRAGSADGRRPSFPGFSGASGEPLPEPSEQPEVQLGQRVNILLVGIDSGLGADHTLTDTMLVVSIDPDGDSAMISVPRDMVNVPLPSGEIYPHKLNSLMQRAIEDPERYPLGGVGTLKATIGRLLGAPIHYFAAVDLAGFRDTIDAIGGVQIEVERTIDDPFYELPDGRFGFFLEEGTHFLDGETALAYVRSRQGAGDDDFTRAERQQRLLTAIQEKLTRTNLLTALPALLDAVKNTVATDVPARRIPQLAQAVQDSDVEELERVVLQPPEFVTSDVAVDGAYILIPDLPAIRRLGQELIGG